MKSTDEAKLFSSSFLTSDTYRNLQAEYDRLKQQHEHKGLSPLPSPPEMMPTSPQSPRDAELIAEAKLLRQHKGRLEARMQILEDHNKQLESQLHRLRQLLEQVRHPHLSKMASSKLSHSSFKQNQKTELRCLDFNFKVLFNMSLTSFPLPM